MGIYFLRHIRTVYNLENRLSGRTEVPTLPNEKLVLPNQSINFDVILSSPAQRCRETLRLLENEWNQQKSTIHYLPELHERNLGDLEGLRRSEAVEMYPSLFHNRKLRVNAVPPNGETISDVIDRITPIAENIMNICCNNKNLLIVSHNQVMKILSAILSQTEINDDYWLNQNYENGVLYLFDDSNYQQK